MILTMTKYHENLLREGTLSLLSLVKLFSFLETKMIIKSPNETFLRITRYLMDKTSILQSFWLQCRHTGQTRPQFSGSHCVTLQCSLEVSNDGLEKNKQTNEGSAAREQNWQWGASKWMSGASEWSHEANDLARRFDMIDQFLPQVKGRDYVRSGQSS